MATDIARVAIIAVIGVVLFSPFVSVVNSNSGVQTIENETVTADFDNYVELDGYDLVDGTVTVDDGSGATYSEGTDYELNQSAGSIHALSGGTITDGQSIEVSYEYQATDGTTSTIIGLLPLFLALLILVILAAKAMSMMP
jgi:hypothetical protein